MLISIILWTIYAYDNLSFSCRKRLCLVISSCREKLYESLGYSPVYMYVCLRVWLRLRIITAGCRKDVYSWSRESQPYVSLCVVVYLSEHEPRDYFMVSSTNNNTFPRFCASHRLAALRHRSYKWLHKLHVSACLYAKNDRSKYIHI